ncbi:MAG: hypothetical protein QCI82_05670 [Candidatus Thermoplasmatota archaeon]|nr:hypothetical protein [Candidatus Thermoplasmatota archaeon]
MLKLNKKIMAATILLFSLILALSLSNHGIGDSEIDTDQVSFIIGGEKGNIITDHFYVNELNSLGLLIHFANDCIFYRIKIEGPNIFHFNEDSSYENISKGTSCIKILFIDYKNTSIKNDFLIYLNYTLNNNINITKTFNLVLFIYDSFYIEEITYPSENNPIFSLDVKFNISFDEVMVLFGSDGNIRIKNELIKLNNVSIGNYTFSTEIFIDTNHSNNDNQELSYDIISRIGNRSIQILKYNIPIKYSYYDNNKNTDNDHGDNNYIIYLILLLILILSIVIVLFVYKRRKIIKPFFIYKER